MTTLDQARSHPACGEKLYLNEKLHEHFWPGQGPSRYNAEGGEYDEKRCFRGPFLALGDAQALLNVMVADSTQLALLEPLMGHTLILERRKGQGPGWYTISLVAQNEPVPAVSCL